MDTLIEQEEPAVSAAASPESPEPIPGEDELWQMVAKVRSEFPNGFFYLKSDETVSDGPFVLLSIEAEDRGPLQDGSKDIIHYAKIRRADGSGEPQKVMLGELMRKPLIAAPGHR